MAGVWEAAPSFGVYIHIYIHMHRKEQWQQLPSSRNDHSPLQVHVGKLAHHTSAHPIFPSSQPIEPAISVFAEAGVFDAVAGLLSQHASPAGPTSPPSPSPSPRAPPARRSLNGGLAFDVPATPNPAADERRVMEASCGLIGRLATAIGGVEGGRSGGGARDPRPQSAARKRVLPAGLAAHVPRLLRQAAMQLVGRLTAATEQLTVDPDRAMGAIKQQEAVLSAMRQLLVAYGTEIVPLVCAEAAEAEGVPACLRAVALMSGAALGDEGASGIGWDVGACALTATSLLADITASIALHAAEGGRPAQAAEALALMQPVVVPLVAQVEASSESCRAFCHALYHLSIIRCVGVRRFGCVCLCVCGGGCGHDCSAVF